MASGPQYLVDTNILLRLTRHDDPQHEFVALTIEKLAKQGLGLCFALQNVTEFWNVCTRPVDRNGYGLTIVDTNLRVEHIEHTMTFLPDSEQVYSIWRRLVIAKNVRGVQVHDAHLVAIMMAYGLTKNPDTESGGFSALCRYSGGSPQPANTVSALVWNSCGQRTSEWVETYTVRQVRRRLRWRRRPCGSNRWAG
jgi:predicted nucleic acid-binding protein